MANARTTKNPAIAVSLGQKKEYDRVHPEYLHNVVIIFGFPSSVAPTLLNFFFGTKINIFINGCLGARIDIYVKAIHSHLFFSN